MIGFVFPISLLLLFAKGSSAQDHPKPIVTVHIGKGPTLASFRREMADQRGCLVILPGGDPRWASRMKDLLQQEPLGEMEMNFRIVAQDTPLGRELRAFHGWSSAPRWALLGRDLRVLCQGESIPKRPELLAIDLQTAGWKTRLEVVSDFIRQHPDHLEAQWERLYLLFSLAERRVKPLLAEGKSDELRHPLTEDEDKRIFGPIARAMEAVLKDPAFVTGFLGMQTTPRMERHSPLIQAVARKGRLILESQLRRNGTDQNLWGLWVYFHALSPGDALGLVASIPTVTGEPPFIQAYVLPPLLKQARETGRWEPFLALALRSWQSTSGQSMGFSTKPNFRHIWDSQASLVVEAQLRLGRIAEADATVQAFLAWSGESAAATWASNLAQTCGKPQRAKAWGGLQPPTEAGAKFAALPEKFPENAHISISHPGVNMDALDLRTFLKMHTRDSGLLLIRLSPGMDANGAWTQEELDGEGSWWKLRSHPAVEDLELQDRSVAMDSKTGRELRGIRGWPTEARWALVDVEGQILGAGLQVPTPAELVQVVRATGYRSRYEQVEAFLREHPDHPEALREFLSLAISRAQRRQRRLDEPIQAAKQRREQVEALIKDPTQVDILRSPELLEKKVAEIRQKYGTKEEALARQVLSEMQAMLTEYGNPPELPPAQEAPEWVEAARILTALLDQPDWAANSHLSGSSWMDAAQQSPSFQRAAQVALPKVEALLLRCPTSYKVWEMWRGLLRTSGIFDLDVLDRIQRPGCPDGPPEHFSRQLEEVLKMAGRWAELRPLLLSRWDEWLAEESGELTGNFSEFDSLIAADLHLGFTQEAEAHLEILLKTFGESSSPWVLDSASRAAKEAGQKELADTWNQRSQAIRRAQMEQHRKKEEGSR